MSDLEIVDVTARDGLQNESVRFSTTQKLELIARAMASGARRLEVASFVHPKYVPQMADAEAVVAGLPEREDCTFVGLVLNARGLARALETRIDEIGTVASASDGFGMRNQGQSRRETVATCQALVGEALAAGRGANVTISVAFGCPFDGEVELDTVRRVAGELAEANPREIAVADTIGVADPWAVEAMFTALSEDLPGMPLRAHFHDTRGTGLANVAAAVRAGVRTIDVSIGGLGGCPFAPGATGNVAAEDVVWMLERAGFETGISVDRLLETSTWLEGVLKRPVAASLGRAGPFPR